MICWIFMKIDVREIREIRNISLVMSQSVSTTKIFSIVKLQKISSQEPTEISKKPGTFY